jgi:uncharacterized LabA/DUF88 family protein
VENIGKITRISIFVDYDNFAISYCKKFNLKEEEISIWDGLCDLFINYYQTNFIKNTFEVVDHVGTFLCVGLSENIYRVEEKIIKQRFKELDRKKGFIIKYGDRTTGYTDKKGKFNLGKEKGVDAEIICQMLMGAFLDHYDACILMSDDADYLPAVNRAQDYFGKKVIQAGFHKSKLREHSYANIPLEDANKELIIESMR